MSDEDNQRVGTIIRQARRRQRLSQIQLAELVNMSQMAISDLEQGKRALKVTEVRVFAKALDVSVTDLIPQTGDLDRQTIIDNSIAILKEIPGPLLRVASEILAELSKLPNIPLSVFQSVPVKVDIQRAEKPKYPPPPDMRDIYRVFTQISVEPYDSSNTTEEE